ncbi:MAG TPA: 16S rRNA (adenine(1518)-N(6)/adenine(1519)-N(6))-dimethyltransferase RsmA [Crenotrichaceae bacterium]|nr:16S rRNA (adenine(1518)-N(6)/adenine(1519)-N(6))-dimethyltransferase RsmA [Crenotrichaceae bacterium]
MSHKPRKRFGQNFLTDEQVVSRIIHSIHPQPHQHLIEIGPGQGVLTDFLADSCRQLDLVEIDRDLVALLSRKYLRSPHVAIHQLDALKLDLSMLLSASDASPPEAERLRLIGNLPYNISTPLMFHLLEQSDDIADMHFMLQKEVADRICAQPGSKKYARLSVITQYLCQVSQLFDVAPESFNPQPKVWSSFVRLTPYQQPPVVVESFSLLNTVVTQAFSQRRKTLRNTLSTLLTEDQIRAVDIDPGRRAETLSLQEFADLTTQVSKVRVE